jgi:hypothetical protein
MPSIKIIRPTFPEGYVLDPKALLTWAHVVQRLTEARHYWLCSVRPDGRPHVAPRWAVWIEDRLYYDGSPETRHARNIAANPRVALHLESGVRFNAGLQAPSEWRSFAEVVAHSPDDELDFALVRLTQPASGTPVKFAPEAPYVGQSANILQHPRGADMQVALRYNEVVAVEDTRVYYITDTDYGSSGSPVLNDNWPVIALDHAGLRAVQNANEGIPILAMSRHLVPHLQHH